MAINRKRLMNLGSDHDFWNHYHRMIELCYEGNEEILDRIKKYDKNEFIKRHYVMANIPEKYFKFKYSIIKNYLLGQDHNKKEIEKLDKYLNSLDKAAKKGIGLYLSGSHGTAKTTIATIILRRAIKKRFKCFFWKSAEIVEFIRSGWKNEYRRIFFDYVINNVDFLVIDDVARLFGIEKTNAEQLYIDQIFTKRDDKNLATIITANHSLDKNKKHFGEALYSNFKERLIEILLVGEDFRNKIGKNLLNEL